MVILLSFCEKKEGTISKKAVVKRRFFEYTIKDIRNEAAVCTRLAARRTGILAGRPAHRRGMRERRGEGLK